MPDLIAKFPTRAELEEFGVGDTYYLLLEVVRHIWAIVELVDPDGTDKDMFAALKDFGSGMEGVITEEGGRYLRDHIPTLQGAGRLAEHLAFMESPWGCPELYDLAQRVRESAAVMAALADGIVGTYPEDMPHSLIHAFDVIRPQVRRLYSDLVAAEEKLGAWEQVDTEREKEKAEKEATSRDGAWAVLKDIPGVARAGDTISVRGQSKVRHVRLDGDPIADHQDRLHYLGAGKKSAEQLNEDVGKALDLPVRDMTEDPPEATV